MRSIRHGLLALAFVIAGLVAPVAAQTLPPSDQAGQPAGRRFEDIEYTPPIAQQWRDLRHALTRLPIAAGLACVLALRPRRKGTPQRQAPVIQTQIILAVVGAVVMLVVGSSLARAFGIVGAAGLVRYRAKIEDPKDAGVMLSTLAVGLAAGVGVYLLAVFATVFILGLLWIVESFEPKATQLFMLKVTAKDPDKLKPQIEKLLSQYKLAFDLRGASKEDLHYEVKMPLNRKNHRLSDLIQKIDPENISAVEWEEKKDKKK